MDERVGEQLRAARKHRRLTLGEVEAVTAGEFRVSVLGAYERGERSIRVHRLLRLAEIYGIPAATLLPPTVPIRKRPSVSVRDEDLDSASPRTPAAEAVTPGNAAANTHNATGAGDDDFDDDDDDLHGGIEQFGFPSDAVL